MSSTSDRPECRTCRVELRMKGPKEYFCPSCRAVYREASVEEEDVRRLTFYRPLRLTRLLAMGLLVALLVASGFLLGPARTSGVVDFFNNVALFVLYASYALTYVLWVRHLSARMRTLPYLETRERGMRVHLLRLSLTAAIYAIIGIGLMIALLRDQQAQHMTILLLGILAAPLLSTLWWAWTNVLWPLILSVAGAAAWQRWGDQIGRWWHPRAAPAERKSPVSPTIDSSAPPVARHATSKSGEPRARNRRRRARRRSAVR